MKARCPVCDTEVESASADSRVRLRYTLSPCGHLVDYNKRANRYERINGT